MGVNDNSSSLKEKPPNRWLLTLSALAIILLGLFILNSIVIADHVRLADLERTGTAIVATNEWIVQMLTQTAVASSTLITATPAHP
jgi:succinate dehydrogenase hydrophobic anchor subunit